MAERPYICESGHDLANGVTTCPRCGTRGRPVRRDLTFYAGMALLVVAIIGGGATLLGRDGGAAAPTDGNEESAATDPVPVWTDDPTTTTDATTSTVDPTTTSSAPTSTTGPPVTTTTPPTTTAAPRPEPTPPTTAARRPRPAPDRPRRTPVAPTTTTPRPPSPAEEQLVARSAAIVAFTSGHAPSGHLPVTTLIAPPLRPRLRELTTRAGYREAGCRQEVTQALVGPARGNRYEFSITLAHACERTPVENGFPLPLTSGAHAVVTIGPSADGTVWAVDLATS